MANRNPFVPVLVGTDAQPVLDALSRLDIAWGSVSAARVVEGAHEQARFLCTKVADRQALARLGADLRRELAGDRAALELTDEVALTEVGGGLLVSFVGIAALEAGMALDLARREMARQVERGAAERARLRRNIDGLQALMQNTHKLSGGGGGGGGGAWRMMPSYPQPPQLCVRCGYFFDRAAVAVGKEAKPVAGDLSFCLNCAALLEYDAALRLRPVGEDALADVPANERAVIERQRAFIRRRGPIPRTPDS